MCPRCYLHKDGRSLLWLLGLLWLRVRILGSGWCRFGFGSLAGQAQKAFRSLISHCKFLCQRLCVCVCAAVCVLVCVCGRFSAAPAPAASRSNHTHCNWTHTLERILFRFHFFLLLLLLLLLCSSCFWLVCLLPPFFSSCASLCFWLRSRRHKMQNRISFSAGMLKRCCCCLLLLLLLVVVVIGNATTLLKHVISCQG